MLSLSARFGLGCYHRWSGPAGLSAALHLRFGRVVAGEIIDGITAEEWSFRNYPDRVAQDEMLQNLARRRKLASVIFPLLASRAGPLAFRTFPLFAKFLCWWRPGCLPLDRPEIRQLPDAGS